MTGKPMTSKSPLTVETLLGFQRWEIPKEMTGFDAPGKGIAMLYAETGNVLITEKNRRTLLLEKDLMLCRTSELQSMLSLSENPSVLLVLFFSLRCPCGRPLPFFKITPKSAERELIGQIFSEAQLLFSSGQSEMPSPPTRIPSETVDFNYPLKSGLKILLVRLLEQYSAQNIRTTAPPGPARTEIRDPVCLHLLNYLESHLHEPLTLNRICVDNHMGRSQIEEIFHAHFQSGIMSYFQRLKTEEARRLILRGTLNFTQISDILGYSSPQYFSRQFKQLTGMTPSQYATSIRKYAK